MFYFKETDYIKKITTVAKKIENQSYREDRFNINEQDDSLMSDDDSNKS